MKLRDHPLVHWPEIWTHLRLNKHITSETGNLITVVRIPEGRMMVMAIDHGGERYVGSLLCEDLKFAEKLHELLLQHVGEPIREVADLDVLREL